MAGTLRVSGMRYGIEVDHGRTVVKTSSSATHERFTIQTGCRWNFRYSVPGQDLPTGIFLDPSVALGITIRPNRDPPSGVSAFLSRRTPTCDTGRWLAFRRGRNASGLA